ncbi:MAG: PHP domain-containing protein [Candidatus Latescibacteria bacterium]|nr:PHP domain-containing protein [Candidatus Latescibacterota bacterium]
MITIFNQIFGAKKPEKKYCDLHIHSTFSDGLLTPQQIVASAKERELDAVSIVDHDAVGGIEPAIQIGKKLGVEVVPAVEMSCMVGDADVHIIGYYIDYQNKKLITVLNDIQAKRVDRAKKIVEKLTEQGADVEIKRVLEIAGNGAVGRPHIAQALLEEGHISSYDEAFWKYIGYHCPAYVLKERLSPLDAMKLIKDFHGVSILAHPMIYNNRSLIAYLIDQGIQGLELWRCEHSDNEMRYLNNLITNHHLIATGGTDCHGGRKGKILIGESKVPYQAVKDLKHAR